MAETEFSFVVDGAVGAARRIRLAGRLSLAEGQALWQRLQQQLRQGGDLVVDLDAVHRLDGGIAALLVATRNSAVAAGASVEFVGAHPEVAQLLALYTPARGEHPPLAAAGVLARIGGAVAGVLQQARGTLEFAGDFVLSLGGALARPRSVNFGAVATLLERAGADGLPIVVVINFLIGVILGLQGAIQLHRFGGDPFLANLVGLSVVRELGPLMTAILVAGRSGAAYAAELGTMTVSEEIDALRTLGQEPLRFLVFPRLLALVVAVPLLTVLADVVGCIGGLFISVSYLELPPITYLQMLQKAVRLTDVMTGLGKSGAFALLIGMVACQRGLATRDGAEGVGRSTTNAVVVVLFGLVALDAAFTWVFSLLRW